MTHKRGNGICKKLKEKCTDPRFYCVRFLFMCQGVGVVEQSCKGGPNDNDDHVHTEQSNSLSGPSHSSAGGLCSAHGLYSIKAHRRQNAKEKEKTNNKHTHTHSGRKKKVYITHDPFAIQFV